jgi:beta-galactosidase
MIPFGAQYYRFPTPIKEEWEKDLKTMKKYGLNIIRAWLMWNRYNPAPNHYDFDEIKELQDLCLKHGIKIIMLTNLESSPGWLYKKYPEAVHLSRADIPKYPDAVHNTAGGGHPGLCFDNDAIRKEAEKYLDALVKAVGKHEAIYCWEPHNEPMIEAARYHDEVFCYCKATQEKFREWLKKRYRNDIEALNRQWKRKFSEWDEVIPPRWPGSWADWIDWRNFAMDALASHVRWRMEAIARNKPRGLMKLHVRGESGITRNPVVEGIDDWRFTRLGIDVYGGAGFPSDWQPLSDYCLSIETVRCATEAGGIKEFWQSELQAGQYCIGMYRAELVSPERLMIWSWLPIAYGASGLLYWQYRMERYGPEYAMGLTNLDGSPTANLEAVNKMSAILQENEELFKNARTPKPKIAFGFTPNNYILHWVGEGNIHAVRDSIRGLYRALWETDYPVDIVRLDEEVMDTPYAPYQIIYLPCPTWISAHSAEKLKDFVSRGGTLVSEASLAQYDDQFYASEKVPGMGLDEVFGCERDYIVTREKSTINYNQIQIPSTYYHETLIPREAKVLARFENGEVAVTHNTYGKGEAIYIGSNPFMAYARGANSNLLSLTKTINAKVERLAYTDRTETIARVTVTGNKKLVFLFNTTLSNIKTELTITKESQNPTDLLSGKRFQIQRKGKDAVIEDSLKGFEIRVFLFE